MSRLRDFLINAALAAPLAAIVYAGSEQWGWPAQLALYFALVLSLFLWQFESMSADGNVLRNIPFDVLVAAPFFAVLFYGLESGGWAFSLFLFSLVVRMFLRSPPIAHDQDTDGPGQSRWQRFLALVAVLLLATVPIGAVVWYFGKPVKPVSLDTKSRPYAVAASATAMAVMFTTPREVTEPVRIWAGLAGPSRIGPTGSASPNTFMIW